MTQPRVTQYAKGRTQQTLLDMGGHHDVPRFKVILTLRTGWPIASFFVKKLHSVNIFAASRRLTLSDGSSLGGATRGG